MYGFRFNTHTLIIIVDRLTVWFQPFRLNDFDLNQSEPRGWEGRRYKICIVSMEVLISQKLHRFVNHRIYHETLLYTMSVGDGVLRPIFAMITQRASELFTSCSVWTEELCAVVALSAYVHVVIFIEYIINNFLLIAQSIRNMIFIKANRLCRNRFILILYGNRSWYCSNKVFQFLTSNKDVVFVSITYSIYFPIPWYFIIRMVKNIK